MTLKAALFASLLALTSCATRSNPPPVEQPGAPAVDPRLCLDPKPEPPVAGAIVRPADDRERAAVGDFLTGEAAARDWGREGWKRAAVAKGLCR